MADKSSPFLYPGHGARADRLAILHLKRDLQIPTILKEHDEDDEGYFEGKVVNTRFGSFPHSTLIGVSWGSQVLASKVDTGSRGRRDKGGDKKRKRGDSEERLQAKKRSSVDNGEEADGDASTPGAVTETREAVAAASGFIHLLPPTPENWTSSLPHRTQVVYTPDYSYILHRLRARPGTNIIEAGAGSGSFTHASARAVFNGYPGQEESDGSISKKRKLGKVWSYEFHEQRHEKLVEEVQDHGLEGIVEITHRDVCADGFLIDRAVSAEDVMGKSSPCAEAIFLDLPAPWLALPHLVRSKPASTPDAKAFVSPLNPTASVQLCTFSPCIEQVQRTVSTMRHLGWVDIEMVELSQKRFEIRRERIGIDSGAQRGQQLTPSTVEEAVARLKEVEGNFKAFHENGEKVEAPKKVKTNPNNREAIMESLVERKIYKEGRLVHRTEAEVKTHTSYLVFAVLPREWSEEDEAKAREMWPVVERKEDDKPEVAVAPKSKKQLKREARAAGKEAAEARRAAVGGVVNGAVVEGDAMAIAAPAERDDTNDAMEVDTNE